MVSRSRIYRLRLVESHWRYPCIFCYSSEEINQVDSCRISPSKQIPWSEKWSGNPPIQQTVQGKISKTIAKSKFSGWDQKSNIGVLNQQFYFVSRNYCCFVQSTLGDRTVFQMDQAKPQSENFLWYFLKRSKNPNLDCYDCLSHLGHSQGEIFTSK